MQIQTVTIKFPDINLSVRDAHKLRGYFGEVFREQSPLLHNHLESGENRYSYPLVQYKVLGQIPCLIGINEGAGLLVDLFLKIKELKINDIAIPVLSKNIESKIFEIGVNGNLHHYHFETLWMGLNQDNHRKYMEATDDGKQQMLDKTLIGNILSFYKAMGLFVSSEIIVNASLSEKSTKFKNNDMIAFSGSFSSNAILPQHIGLGKSVARGFGAIKEK